MKRTIWPWAALLIAGTLGVFVAPLVTPAVAGESDRLAVATPSTVAAETNRLLKEESHAGDKGSASASTQAASRCDDETFLRRAYLDLVGRSPPLNEVVLFMLDPDAHKREKLIDKLLADSRYGENWGRYWRDVIMYRRTEDRALISAPAMTEYLTDEFNKNTPWDKIVTSFVTALGPVAEDGRTGLIMAQAGQPEETVAEISRIFLGIQIQCAQCHDHPTDRWKREQFHELAAFFPRVSVRPSKAGDIRSFAVVADDSPARGPRPNNNRFRGTPEHYMPDLQRPQDKGKLMTPVLFTSGQKLNLGTKDEDRRAQLAAWLTARENPWFAKAFVNRVWAELVGEGFYEPVDDMGPDRECSAEKTLAHLAATFARSGYDVKWLYRTVMLTDAYQHSIRSRRTPDGVPFLANIPQRLRGDQLFNQLVAVLGVVDGGGNAGGRPQQRGIPRGPRGMFNAAFGYDPSGHREEVTGSIPQALVMMNSPLVNQAISVRGSSGLGRLLTETRDNEAAVTELYLKTLSREPSEKEMQTCLSYIKQLSLRNEAFEDILWSLVNSTEFLHRK